MPDLPDRPCTTAGCKLNAPVHGRVKAGWSALALGAGGVMLWLCPRCRGLPTRVCAGCHHVVQLRCHICPYCAGTLESEDRDE